MAPGQRANRGAVFTSTTVPRDPIESAIPTKDGVLILAVYNGLLATAVVSGATHAVLVLRGIALGVDDNFATAWHAFREAIELVLRQ